MEEITYRPIGVIRSPFSERKGMPIQPIGALGVRGSIELRPDLAPGLKDLQGFSHLILLYHFHESEGYSLEVQPFLDDKTHGIFASRAPLRPNPIGLSVVRLVSVEEDVVHIEDVDILDGTPLLDIKPYIPEFDSKPEATSGWLGGRAAQARDVRADERFWRPTPESETEPPK
ncbi:MAG: tRNA (N6-threonylcarbamoyladenosine(37)-N6)-methyltransferase TrmO [Thermodesulfobacteriota bacterium]